MRPNQNSTVPAGWMGGFAESNPKFAYPNPDLNSLPMLDNMANIPRIKRQQSVYWPEFSWQTIQGKEDSRCFQMFAHNISSIGYDNAGRIWSIICPQQGVCVGNITCLNVEVTVTGQRGWVDETNPELGIASDMTVEGKIWFSPSSHQNWLVKRASDLFAENALPFPSSKANAIQVSTHRVNNPAQPDFSIRAGESNLFVAPDFARHPDQAWSVGNIGVQIGDIVSHNHSTVDTFNQKILDLFNIASVLTWNLWFRNPQLVDTEQWRTHAEKWRKSIDADHGPRSSDARYGDGSLFKPRQYLLAEIQDVVEIIESLI
jgi:hypothetical protein